MKPIDLDTLVAELVQATADMPLPNWAQANRKVVLLSQRDPVYRAKVIILGKHAEWRSMFVREAMAAHE